MNVFQKFLDFLNGILLNFKKRQLLKKTEIPMLDEEEILEDDKIILRNIEGLKLSAEEDRINVEKRTLMTRFYVLEQEITVFEQEFPEEFTSFMEKIQMLREDYDSLLENLNNKLTFDLDPEFDGNFFGKVVKLENEVKEFIEKDVKFNIISKRLQRLIIKLNILYNVSIIHFKDEEKEKVISQLEHALEVEKEIATDFKNCDYILKDIRLKERVIDLISYVDYLIFKTGMRNSSQTPDELLQKLVLKTEFYGFNYVTSFIAFIKDEISDLIELLPLLSDDLCRENFETKLTQLLKNITYSNNENVCLADIDFWNDFFNLETTLLEVLKANGVSKEKAKVRTIIRMNISVNESEVITTPTANTYLSLVSLFATTHDGRLLVLLKLIKNVSNDVTYKEIYFLLQLFEVIEIIEESPNDLNRYIQKYLKKYPYNRETITEKKQYVIASSNKEYVYAFSLDRYTEEIIATLKKLNMDFKIDSDKIFINSFYFNSLSNLLKSLQNNTANIN